jgi:hypothetical protein
VDAASSWRVRRRQRARRVQHVLKSVAWQELCRPPLCRCSLAYKWVCGLPGSIWQCALPSTTTGPNHCGKLPPASATISCLLQ